LEIKKLANERMRRWSKCQ